MKQKTFEEIKEVLILEMVDGLVTKYRPVMTMALNTMK